jgi:hypothetical protein
MQKGKEGYCGLSGAPLLMLSCAVLLLAAEAEACGGISGLPPWKAARGGAVEPAERLGALDLFQSGRYAGLVVSSSYPYGIRDLRAHHMMLCGRGEGWGFTAGWEALRYPHYLEDRLTAAAAVEKILPRVSAALEYQLERRGVAGFPKLALWRLDGTLLAACSLFEIAASCLIAGDTGYNPISFGCSAGGDAIALVFNCDIFEARLIEPRLGFRFAWIPALCFMSGYRFSNDEITFGIESESSGIMFVMSWSHHPAIGQTISLGMGWLWLR